MKKLTVLLVKPDKNEERFEASFLRLESKSGMTEIMPGCEPLILALSAGEILSDDGSRSIQGGFIIIRNDLCKIVEFSF